MAKKARTPEPTEVTRKQAVLSKRERSAQRNVLIFAGVIGVAIVAIFGIGLVRTGTLFAGQTAVAVVNGERISVADMRKRVRLSYFSVTQNQPVDPNTGLPQEIDVVAMADATLNDMITEVLVRQAAAEMGITAGESEIDDGMRLALGFRPLGDTVPASSAATPFPTLPPTTPTATSTFVFTPTPSPTAEGVAGEIEPTPIATVAPTEIPEEASEADATPTPTATPTQGPPTEEEEAAFRQEYEARLDEWTGASGMTEAEIRDLFAYSVIREKLFDEVDLGISTETERALVAHIVVETEEEADALLQKIEAGEDFSVVAAENSIDSFSAYRGGELGWISGEQVEQLFSVGFADLVDNQPLGEPGGPVETTLGYHLVLIYDRQVVPLSEVEYLVSRQQEFSTYLTNLRADAEENIEIEENWQRYLPALG